MKSMRCCNLTLFLGLSKSRKLFLVLRLHSQINFLHFIVTQLLRHGIAQQIQLLRLILQLRFPRFQPRGFFIVAADLEEGGGEIGRVVLKVEVVKLLLSCG